VTRLDFQSLNDAIDLRRSELGLTWEQLGEVLAANVDELHALNESTHMGLVFRAIDWTGLDIDDFLVEAESAAQREQTTGRAERVAAFLRADRELKPESADAIEAVLKAAYDRFAAAQ